MYECENKCGSLLCVLFKVFNRGEGLTQRLGARVVPTLAVRSLFRLRMSCLRANRHDPLPPPPGPPGAGPVKTRRENPAARPRSQDEGLG